MIHVVHSKVYLKMEAGENKIKSESIKQGIKLVKILERLTYIIIRNLKNISSPFHSMARQRRYGTGNKVRRVLVTYFFMSDHSQSVSYKPMKCTQNSQCPVTTLDPCRFRKNLNFGMTKLLFYT